MLKDEEALIYSPRKEVKVGRSKTWVMDAGSACYSIEVDHRLN